MYHPFDLMKQYLQSDINVEKSLYFVCLSDSHIEETALFVESQLKTLSVRNTIWLDCTGKTYLQILNELTDRQFKTTAQAQSYAREFCRKSKRYYVIKNLSKANITEKKGLYLYSIIKPLSFDTDYTSKNKMYTGNAARFIIIDHASTYEKS